MRYLKGDLTETVLVCIADPVSLPPSKEPGVEPPLGTPELILCSKDRGHGTKSWADINEAGIEMSYDVVFYPFVDDAYAMPRLSPVEGKPIIARFDRGSLSTDGGLLALREVEDRLDVAPRFAACIDDPCAPERIRHGLADMLRSRLLMIATGYEDGNDANSLRHDPFLTVPAEGGVGIAFQRTALLRRKLRGRSHAVPDNVTRVVRLLPELAG